MLGHGNSSGSNLLFAAPYGREPTDAVRLVGTVAAVLSIAAGVIHISAAGDHTNLPVMFVGFMIVATLQVAVGALLFWRRPSKLLIAAALALTVSSLGMWLLSRTAGLPFLEGGHVEPIGFKDGVTKLFELGTIPALLLLLSRDLSAVSLPSPRLSSQTLGVLGASVFALMTPAMLLDGGAHHSHDQAVAMGIHHDDNGHVDAHELAQAHAESGDAHGAATHHVNATGHNHAGSANAAGAHRHTDHELASTRHHLGHEHAGGGPHGQSPTHHTGGNEREHGSGQHEKSHPEGDQDHSGGGHGHGDHEGGHGGGSDDDEPISVSYEPSPSVCISAADICVP